MLTVRDPRHDRIAALGQSDEQARLFAAILEMR